MIKGYVTPFGYMGYIDGHYQKFPTEQEYVEEVRERNGVLHEQNMEKCGVAKG